MLTIDNLPAPLRPLATALAIARRIDGPMPALWRMSFPPTPDYVMTVEELSGPEWSASLLQYAQQLYTAVDSLPEALDACRQARIRITPEMLNLTFVGVQAAAGEAGIYYSRALGRTAYTAPNFLHWLGKTQAACDRARETDLDPLQVLRGRMSCIGEELSGLRLYLFSSGHSVGWLSEQEREDTLTMISAMTSPEFMLQLRALWRECGGDTLDDHELVWLREWKAFRIAIHGQNSVEPHKTEGAHAMFARHSYNPFIGSARAQNVDDWLALHGISTDPMVIIEELNKLQNIFEAEITRLDRLIQETDPPKPATVESRGDIARLAALYIERFQTGLVHTGILPQAWNPADLHLKVRSPGDKKSRVAFTDTTGTYIEIIQFEGYEDEWCDRYSESLGLIIAHELTHYGQLRQREVSQHSASRLGLEAGAQLVQKTWAVENHDLYTTRAMVRADMQVLVYFRLSLEYALGLQTDQEAILAEIMRVGNVSRMSAERSFKNVSAGVDIYGMYSLGLLWMDEWVRDCAQRNPELATTVLARHHGLAIQPNLLLPHFTIEPIPLYFPDVPLAVYVSQKLH